VRDGCCPQKYPPNELNNQKVIKKDNKISMPTARISMNISAKLKQNHQEILL
jgi:hypothetical protein